MASGVHGNKKAPASKTASLFAQAAARAGLVCQTGKSAVQGSYRAQVQVRAGCVHTESVDLDASLAEAEPHAPRWDYGLGILAASGVEVAIWVEPHPASSSKEVAKMLSKLAWLKTKLESADFEGLRALRDAAARERAIPYRWLVTQTGGIRIAPASKEARQLAQAGLDQPRRQLALP